RRYAVSILAAALSFASAAHAQPAETPYCEVAMEFSLDGKQVAAPSVLVRFGEAADVTIGDPAEHAWHFRVLADAPAVVRRANVIPVGVELYEIAEGREFRRLSPQLKLVPGQRADIDTMFGNGDGRKAHVAIVANPRTEADVEAVKARNAGGAD
ncbi:MAG: hypothetical protein ABW186_13290, partial [Rhodanobacteraceae bacterium]